MKQDSNIDTLIPDVDMPAEVVDRMNRADREEATSADVYIPRRQFLKLSGVVGGGLVLAFSLGRGTRAEAAHHKGGDHDSVEFAPNGYVQIKADGSIIIAAMNPEMGQGVKTSLPMIVAEELEVPWEAVTVIQSEIDKERYGNQVSGGSQSTPRNWNGLRQAGATAREMLIAAAAKKWSVDASDCKAEQAYVINSKNGEKLAYSKLAAAASKMPVPDPKSVPLKERSDYKLLGKFVSGVDNRDIVTGKPLFGFDQQLPGLLYAVYIKCPSFNGVAKSANLDEVKGLPGVVDAFIVKGNNNVEELSSGVAIVAKSTYEAFQAEKMLKVVWDKSGASKDSWSSFVESAKSMTKKPSGNVEKKGDMDAAIKSADKVVESFYMYPFLNHANLEPQSCTAWYHDGKMEILASTQAPQGIPGKIEKFTGVKAANVHIKQLRVGGGFGRRFMHDMVCEAGVIAHRTKVPIKLLWSRETDMAYDFYRVGGFHNFTGTLDANGKLTGLQDRTIVYTPKGDEKGRPVKGGNVRAGALQCPEIPNTRFDTHKVPLQVPTGWWRAPGSCSLAWVFQSFLSEMSDAAGRDHLEFLLEQLGKPRWLREGRANALNTERAINVIKLAAEKSDWGKKMGKDQGRGISFYFSHLGYFAEVAEVTVSDSNKVKVDRVVVAADVGMLLNKSGGENQVEGSIIDGLSTMAGQEISFEDGAVRESNFDDYPMLRMPSQPKIDIHWLTTDYSPTGLGEPAFPPLAPAVTNAIFDATGKRIRTMPISKEGFQIV